MNTSLAKPTLAPLTSLYAASLRGEVVLPSGEIKHNGELHRLLHFVLKDLPLIPGELIKEAAEVHNRQPDCYNYLCSNHAGCIALFEEANELISPLLSCILWALEQGHQGSFKRGSLCSGEGFIFWPAFAANLVDKGEMDVEKYISLIPHLKTLGFNPCPKLDNTHPLDGELLRFSFL